MWGCAQLNKYQLWLRLTLQVLAALRIGISVKHPAKMFCTYGTNKIIIHSSSTCILPL